MRPAVEPTLLHLTLRRWSAQVQSSRPSAGSNQGFTLKADKVLSLSARDGLGIGMPVPLIAIGLGALQLLYKNLRGEG